MKAKKTQRCLQCGDYIDVTNEEAGQMVMCTCGMYITVKSDKPQTQQEFISSHFIVCGVEK